MLPKTRLLIPSLVLLSAVAASAQDAPSVSQVLMYSATAQSGTGVPAGTVPSIFTENLANANLSGFVAGLTNPNDPRFQQFLNAVGSQNNYTISRSLTDLNNALNASIATALSIIPLSSPASGVIFKTDPATGAELPVSSTLGPIFTERAETIGKNKWYIGFSHQDFHFTHYNGESLNALSILYTGGDTSKVVNDLGSSPSALKTVPATFNLGMDVRLSQDITFITYGVTDRFDVSVGLPFVHSAVAARTYDGTIYAGTGFGNPTCWCADTFTPGAPTLQLPQIGQASHSATGFGDLLLRLKANVYQTTSTAIAIGTDLRFATGDAQNYLGVGATSVKPFVAMSFYTKPFANGMVLSPHFDMGWQFTGQSVLGGTLEPTPVSSSLYQGSPFTQTKGYLPDVFNWAVGAEVALGRHNTLIADILGNEIGLVHGIPDAAFESLTNQAAPTGPNGTLPAALGGPTNQPTPAMVTASGLVGLQRVSFGQYSGSFGYKARLFGNLVANFNVLVRFDNNGLVARVVPLLGLGYSF